MPRSPNAQLRCRVSTLRNLIETVNYHSHRPEDVAKAEENQVEREKELLKQMARVQAEWSKVKESQKKDAKWFCMECGKRFCTKDGLRQHTHRACCKNQCP